MEPERPIEKLLRAFAKKRRDETGAPFELHPATRRMLQGEVARKFGKGAGERRSFLQGIIGNWPRLAWGAVVVGLAALLAALILPAFNNGKNPATFAKNDRQLSAPPTESVNAPASAAAPAATPPGSGVSSPAQLADRNSTLFDAEKENALKAEKAAGDKDSLLALSEPRKTETPLTLAAGARDESRSRVAAKSPALEGQSLTESDRAASAQNLRRGGGVSGGIGAASTPPPAGKPSALGGALASRSLGNTALSLEPAPAVSGDAPSVTRAAQPGFAGGPVKPLNDGSYKLEVPPKSAAAPTASPPLSLAESAADNKYRYFADDAKKDVTNVQRFAQVIPGLKGKTEISGKVSPTQKLLVSFQVEQNGRDLRILDGDGSVYSGYLQMSNAAMRLPAAATQESSQTRLYRQKAAVAESEQQPAQNAFFRVAGTNRSLKENVVFTGMLLGVTNVDSSGSVTNSPGAVKRFGGQNLSFENGDPGRLKLLNTTISGKAQVGNAKEIEIKAVPVTR